MIMNTIYVAMSSTTILTAVFSWKFCNVAVFIRILSVNDCTNTRSVVNLRSSTSLDTHASCPDAFLFLSLSLSLLIFPQQRQRFYEDAGRPRRWAARLRAVSSISAVAHCRRYRMLFVAGREKYEEDDNDDDSCDQRRRKYFFHGNTITVENPVKYPHKILIEGSS